MAYLLTNLRNDCPRTHERARRDRIRQNLWEIIEDEDRTRAATRLAALVGRVGEAAVREVAKEVDAEMAAL